MKFEGTLLILDGVADKQGDSFSPDCEVKISKKITVSHEFGKEKKDFLGTAEIFQEGDKVKYSIDLVDSLLPPESFLFKLTPCVGGSILKREGSSLKSVFIRHIGLCMHPADERLEPLKTGKDKA